MVSPMAIKIRSKKLGVLLRDARLTAGKSMKECAEAIGISSSMWSAYERGDKSPSLPEIEVLAYYLDIPVDHFWGQQSRSNQEENRLEDSNLDRLIPLRQRIVGVLLRKARQDADVSMKELGELVGVSYHRIKSYELGERALPLPELEIIANHLKYSIRQFQDQEGPVGRWIMQQEGIEAFLGLPSHLQKFIAKPVNTPFLELAQRLSEMSVDNLRAVAEGLLEITL
jgi:transcriptional regulator with XRE-family HTH domain